MFCSLSGERWFRHSLREREMVSSFVEGERDSFLVDMVFSCSLRREIWFPCRYGFFSFVEERDMFSSFVEERDMFSSFVEKRVVFL